MNISYISFLVALFFNTFSYTLPKLHLIVSDSLYRYLDDKAQNEIENIKKYLEQQNNNYFSSIDILKEDQNEPNFKSGDYYVFFFGWQGESSRSTVFLRSDGYFRNYRNINREINPVMVIFIPLDLKAMHKIKEELYVEFLQLRGIKDLKNNTTHGLIQYECINKLPQDIEYEEFNFIIKWIKETQEKRKQLLRRAEESINNFAQALSTF